MGEKIVFYKKEFIHPKSIFESKKEIRKFCNKLSVKVKLPVEFDREQHNQPYLQISYLRKLKLRHKLTTNTHLKVFIRF